MQLDKFGLEAFDALLNLGWGVAQPVCRRNAQFVVVLALALGKGHQVAVLLVLLSPMSQTL